jgi:hypothetical protein
MTEYHDFAPCTCEDCFGSRLALCALCHEVRSAACHEYRTVHVCQGCGQEDCDDCPCGTFTKYVAK